MKKLFLFICILILCTEAFSENKTAAQRVGEVTKTAATAAGGAAGGLIGNTVDGPKSAAKGALLDGTVTHGVIEILDHAAEAAIDRHFKNEEERILRAADENIPAARKALRNRNNNKEVS